MFTEKEIAYLESQPLARLATVSNDGQPDAVAVGFDFDGQHFYIGGLNLPATRKYKNIAAGHAQVALVIDDLVSVDPWSPRGIRIYGAAAIVAHTGYMGPGEYLRITPSVSWSMNIEASHEKYAVNRIVHDQLN